MGGALIYQPTDCGLINTAGRQVRYYGTTYRVPASAHNTIQQLEWERSPHEIAHPITRDDGSTLVPDPEGAIERTDTLDADTGDLLVTYRVPYIETE
jgi:hypothetical protein